MGNEAPQLVLEVIVLVLYRLSQNVFVFCEVADLLQGLPHLTDVGNSDTQLQPICGVTDNCTVTSAISAACCERWLSRSLLTMLS